jgi:TonB family protein
MRVSIAALIFGLLTSSALLAKAPTPKVFTTYASAEITLEADGSVTEVKFVGPRLGEKLEAALSAKIRAPNLFLAGQVNGKPARTHSLVQLQLRAESDLKNKQTLFSLHNVSISTMALPSNSNFLKYPLSMMQANREARLSVRVTYDAKGFVTDAQIDQTQPKVHIEFRQSALRFARNMKFFVEEVNGIAHGGGAIIPVVYALQDDSSARYTFKLPSGERLEMQAGEPAPEVRSEKTQASLTKPFVPQALSDG